MYAVEFEASIKNGIIEVPKEYQNISDSSVKLIMMYEDDYNRELENNRSIISKQVDKYFNGSSTLLDQEQSSKKMQSFMNSLQEQYEDS